MLISLNEYWTNGLAAFKNILEWDGVKKSIKYAYGNEHADIDQKFNDQVLLISTTRNFGANTKIKHGTNWKMYLKNMIQ